MKSDHSKHKKSDIAFHFDWEFQKEAVRFYGITPVRMNFHPVATEFAGWLLRKNGYSIFNRDDFNKYEAFTNPYAYHSSVIAGILAEVINEAYDYSVNRSIASDTEANIMRIRYLNEQTLYTARFCEVAIKQLLWCTQIPVKLYKRSALGGLLESECQACKKAGKKSHKVSFLGSLAHRYGLCLKFDLCLEKHLRLVNRRRNLEAAHSETQELNIMSVSDSQEALKQESYNITKDLLHMLEHISELEEAMKIELLERIDGAGNVEEA